MMAGSILRWRAHRMPKQTRNAVLSIDQREIPEYSLDEIALYLDVHKSTLGYWTRPTSKDDPLIVAAGSGEPKLSFYNLLEAHILMATKQRDIPIQRIRAALYRLRQQYPNSAHPLLEHEFYSVDGSRDVFIHEIEGGDPVNLSRQGQIAFGALLKKYLRRIEWDRTGPIRLSPLRSNHIVIDLHVSGGRPVVKGTGVLARMIWSRNQAGDSPAVLARDYRLKRRDVEEAIRYIDAA